MPQCWTCPKGTGYWFWMTNARTQYRSHEFVTLEAEYDDNATVFFN